MYNYNFLIDENIDDKMKYITAHNINDLINIHVIYLHLLLHLKMLHFLDLFNFCLITCCFFFGLKTVGFTYLILLRLGYVTLSLFNSCNFGVLIGGNESNFFDFKFPGGNRLIFGIGGNVSNLFKLVLI